LLAAVAVVFAATAAEPSERAQTLASFLRDLQASGVPIVFSEALVRPGMQVSVATRGGPLRQSVERALASCGLALRDGPAGRWLVVEAPPRPPAVPAPVSKLTRNETVEVDESVALSVRPAAASVAATSVQATAGAFGDVFRTLQFQPGVTPVNEVQGRFSVRSGAPEQNLTVVDGVEIHNPFRREALVAAFDPATVDSFVLTTGVMPARYGDRLASVLEVRTRPGRRDKLVSGTVAVEPAASSVTLESPLPGNRGASLLVSARRDTPGNLMQRLTHLDALQRFDDVYGRIDWPWRERAQLSLWTLQGWEGTHDWPAVHDEHSTLVADARLDYRVRSGTWGVTFRASPGHGISSATTVSRDENREDAHESWRIQPYVPDWTEWQQRRVHADDIALRHVLVFERDAARRWEAGFERHQLDSSWRMNGNGVVLGHWWLFRGPSPAPTPWGMRGGAFEPVSVDSARASGRTAAWLQTTLAVAPRLVLEPGVRVEHTSLNGETVVLPRLQAAWRSGSNRVFAAWGEHAQSPGLEKLLLADAFVDCGGTDRLPVRSERSRNTVLGFTRELGRRVFGRVELYHTRFDRLIVGRLQPADPISRSLPMLSDTPVNGATGRAYGAELSLRLRPVSAARGPSAALSYSYGVSRRHGYGRVYPFDYDRRHAVTLTGEVPVAHGMSLAAAWRGASGLPYTPFYAQDTSSGHATPAVRLEDLNAARHPFYARLDLRASYAPRGPGGRFELYVDVFNVLDYDIGNSNGPGFRQSLELGPNGWEVVIVKDRSTSAVVPTFGLRFRF
jgi:hypothetical protein